MGNDIVPIMHRVYHNRGFIVQGSGFGVRGSGVAMGGGSPFDSI